MVEKKRYSMRVFATILAISLISMGFISGFMVNYIMVDELPLDEAVEKTKQWISIPMVFGADTGDGTDAIVNIYTVPLAEISANITSSPYETNEAVAYEHGDDVDGFDDGEELADTTPYGVAHALVIEVNFSNKAYNSSTADWETGLVRAYITSSDLGLGSPTLMSEASDFSQQDGSTSAHLSFYYDNSGSGVTLGQGETVSVTDWDCQYYGTPP